MLNGVNLFLTLKTSRRLEKHSSDEESHLSYSRTAERKLQQQHPERRK